MAKKKTEKVEEPKIEKLPIDHAVDVGVLQAKINEIIEHLNK